MKIDRLLGILTTLLNNDKTKAKDLAEKFEVSIRTIHRDIEAICCAGIPIVTIQGGDGGIRIAEGYKLDKSLLTSSELTDILIGLKSIDSITKGSNIKLLLEKLAPGSQDILTVNNDILIDLSSFYKTSLAPKISTLREAINKKQIICFDYFSRKGMHNRCIEPYFITFRWSAWYVFGFCTNSQAFRLFKLNRIINLSLGTGSFVPREIPKDKIEFDNYFNENEEVITLLLHPSMEYKIVENYGVDSYIRTADNRLQFELSYTNHEFAIETILAFGNKAKVISPEHIVKEIKGIAENILGLYK